MLSVDGRAARVSLNIELRDNLLILCRDLKIALNGDLSLADDAVLARPAQAGDAQILIAALPRIDPTLRSASEPSEGLSVVKLPDGALRIGLTDVARNSRIRLWRDRGRLEIEQALARREGVRWATLTLPDESSFLLTLENWSRAQWERWIGGQIDLFFSGKFSLAPLAAGDAKGEYPRAYAGAASAPHVAIDAAKRLENAGDMVFARVEGVGTDERLILQWPRPGVHAIGQKALPTSDKSALALMFDSAVAALVELEGAAVDGAMRCKVTAGLSARQLGELILKSGSPPVLRQVDARFD
jgi:hypothetical protein